MCGWAHGLVSVKALFQCVDGPMVWYLLRLCSSVWMGPMVWYLSSDFQKKCFFADKYLEMCRIKCIISYSSYVTHLSSSSAIKTYI